MWQTAGCKRHGGASRPQVRLGDVCALTNCPGAKILIAHLTPPNCRETSSTHFFAQYTFHSSRDAQHDVGFKLGSGSTESLTCCPPGSTCAKHVMVGSGARRGGEKAKAAYLSGRP